MSSTCCVQSKYESEASFAWCTSHIRDRERERKRENEKVERKIEEREGREREKERGEGKSTSHSLNQRGTEQELKEVAVRCLANLRMAQVTLTKAGPLGRGRCESLCFFRRLSTEADKKVPVHEWQDETIKLNHDYCDSTDLGLTHYPQNSWWRVTWWINISCY